MTRRTLKLLLFLGALLLVVWLGYASLGGWVLDQSLIAAVRANDLLRAKALLRSGAHPGALVGNVRTPMLWLARIGYAPGVTTLKRHGVAVDEVSEAGDDWGMTPLIAAAENGDLAMMQVLLAAGAVVNKEDETNRTALEYAILDGQWESVRFLIKHGALVNRTRDGLSPLTLALSPNVRVYYNGSYLKVARELIEGGANVNQKADEGWTPVMFAATSGPFASLERLWEEEEGPQVLELLITHGADLNARNKDGKTALRLAREYRRPTIVRVLRNAGAKE